MAGPIRSYKDLLVWQRGMELVADVYRVTQAWPKDERYGLTSQARRAATSIPANIAEGYGRQTRASYGAFLRIARGSLKELETHLLVAEMGGVADPDQVEPVLAKADELGRMLGGLIRKICLA